MSTAAAPAFNAEDHLGLVRAIARSVAASLPVTVDVNDLAQEGFFGLKAAIRCFDSSHGVAFELYAKKRIRGAILDALRGMDYLTREHRKTIRKLERARISAGDKCGHRPSEEEIAAELGIDLEAFRKMQAKIGQVGHTSLEVTLPEGKSNRQIADPRPLVTDEMACAVANKALAGAMDTLKPRYRRIVELYYFEGVTMRDAGRELGINESRVSQILTAARAQMRRYLTARKLGPNDFQYA